jgi:predicted dehydrogenase
MKRVGIIGSGLIASWHAERWQRLPVEIAGHYDRTPEKAQKAAGTYGGRAFDTLEALLAEVDIVDVCTPTPAHKEGVLAAAAAGKPVICEKPLARHLGDCEEMIAACERAGVPLFVAHVVRFFPQFARAKEVLESGALGRPGVIRTVRGGSFPRPTPDTWYSDFEQGGGVVMDLCIHDLDFARWCFGEIERVFARGLTFDVGNDKKSMRDHALITLRFKNGAIGHVEGSWAFPPGPFRTRLEIAGSEGILEWDAQEAMPVEVLSSGREAADASVTHGSGSPLAPHDDPYYRELEHVLACLENEQPFAVSPGDGLMAVKLALAAIASMRLGKPVDIATFDEDVDEDEEVRA